MRQLLRLALLLRPQWRLAIAGLLLALVTVLANIGLLALSSWFIASMAMAGAVGATMEYALPAAGVRALAILRSTGRYAERLVNHDATLRILGSIRLWFFEKIEPLAPAGLAGFRSGDLLARSRADIDTLDDFYVRGLVPAAVALLSTACVLPFLASFDQRLAWILGAALLAAGLFAPLGLAHLAKAPGRKSVELSAELSASIAEELDGMAELVALGAAAAHATKLDEVASRLDRDKRRLASIRGLGDASFVAFSGIAVAASAYVLVGLVSSGVLPPAELPMLTVLALASFEMIVPLPSAIQKAGEMGEAARRLFQIVDAKPAIQAMPTAGRAAHSPGGERSDLSIRNMSFRYTPDGPPVFRDLTLELPARSRLGLRGPSGSGKSTLVSLLLRFWEYGGGAIELGGKELRSFDPDEARGHFAVVPQSPFLYHASLRENLMLAACPSGETPADFDEERLVEALLSARLGDFLATLPGGLDGVLGESGKAVSVGEARRIAVARAFLKEAPILLLDEPTEGLDDRTAEALLASIAKRADGRSLVLISHRERDFAIVDRVFDLGLQ